ncbi:alpha/beta hydrolase [Trueperella pecoris]|uniref:alpha/beta hydrolase n=1 Tax=Trueperella pecoris TaxID=2733571 RepID=UPI001ABE6EAF|nr:alpha/beta hydrolase [Trueperella pecoris]QTG75914.1 alpha/beta hydrolase [Trueperella pecoris]
MFTSGRSLPVVHCGNGPLVVLCHGVTDSAASLSDLARRLSPDYRVAALDSLGHGLARPFHDAELAAPMQAALEQLTDSIELLVDAYGPAVGIGHSMGGALLTKLAAQRPELFAGVIGEDPAWLSPAQAQSYRDTVADSLAHITQVRRDPAAALAANRDEYPSWPDDERAGWLAGKLEVDLRFVEAGQVGYVDWSEWATDISVPTLIVTGTASDAVLGPSGLAQIAALANPSISTRLVPGARHCVRREDPADFDAIVREFLARVHPPFDADAVIRQPGTQAEVGPQPSQTASFYIDPQLRPELDQPYYPQWDPIGTRLRWSSPDEPPLVDGASLEVVDIDGTTMRIWRAGEPRRVIVAIHGGGFMAGSADGDDERNAGLARRLQAVVVSPEYRLAPEHPFPAGALDCACVAEWARNEWELPFYILGDSAGGGLAESAAVMLLENGERLDGVIMLEPFLDPSMASRSIRTHADAQMWNRGKAHQAWKAYLAGRNPRELPRLVSVGEHRPRVLTIVASADLLRDEGIAWTTKLVDAGFDASLHMISGTFHAGLTLPDTRVRERVFELIADFVGA